MLQIAKSPSTVGTQKQAGTRRNARSVTAARNGGLCALVGAVPHGCRAKLALPECQQQQKKKHSKHVDCKSLSAVVDCDCMTLDVLGNITQPSLHAVVLLDQNIDIRARSLRRHLSEERSDSRGELTVLQSKQPAGR